MSENTNLNLEFYNKIRNALMLMSTDGSNEELKNSINIVTSLFSKTHLGNLPDNIVETLVEAIHAEMSIRCQIARRGRESECRWYDYREKTIKEIFGGNPLKKVKVLVAGESIIEVPEPEANKIVKASDLFKILPEELHSDESSDEEVEFYWSIE